MKKVRETMLDPIEDQEAWNKLIEETKAVVIKNDTATWELVILAGKVDKQYGQNLVKRWADESGLSLSLARQYRWLANRGVNKTFVTKWAQTARKKGLSYTVIREIAGFCGGVDTPAALEYLQWAKEHNATGVAIRGYMVESIAPLGEREELAADFKIAMSDKQSVEGFNDYVLQKLVEVVEENPGMRETVLKTSIVNSEDLEALKVEAGITTKAEVTAVEEAKSIVRRLTNLKRYLRDNRKTIGDAIANDHELSDEVKMLVETIADIGFELSAIKAPDFAPSEEQVEDVTL